jgi:hypothetical protein
MCASCDAYRAARAPALAAQLALLATLVWIATNKVFSPQYMVWIAALLAAWGAMCNALLPLRDSAFFLLACALTRLLYPTYHEALFHRVPSAGLLALPRCAMRPSS